MDLSVIGTSNCGSSTSVTSFSRLGSSLSVRGDVFVSGSQTVTQICPQVETCSLLVLASMSSHDSAQQY
jgi:hypothetical protein